MSNVVESLNTAAMVLGYINLLLLLAGMTWFAGVQHDEWRYKRRRRRQNDIEWDNIRSSWIFNQREEELSDHHVDHINTDVLEITVEQIYDYQKEHGR